MTKAESDIEKLIDRTIEYCSQPNGDFIPFIQQGWLPRKFMDGNMNLGKTHVQTLVKQLQEHGYLKMETSGKPMINGLRERSYAMTDKLRVELGLSPQQR